jgi:ornithine cyclodeaminase/alanine dehydrogenase-like protein (mu-crystallin family)
MTLILNEHEMKSVLPLEATLEALAEAHKQFSTKEAIQPVRTQLPVEKHNGRLLIMPSYLPGSEALSVKILAGYHDNTKIGLPSTFAIVVLHDPNTGKIIAIMDGKYLTGLRTAATAVLASKYMARDRSEILTIIGGGFIGIMSALCFTEEFKLSKIIIYSRSKETVQNFIHEIRSEIEVPIVPVENIQSACEQADIIVAATAARNPIITHSWLQPGTHINALGSSLRDHREVDSETIANSRIVVESMEAALSEAGDIIIPINNGEIDESVIYAELGELVSGDRLGRKDTTEITLFKSVGIAVQDSATALIAYTEAKKKGLGLEVSLISD